MNIIEGNIYDVIVDAPRTRKAYRSNGHWYYGHTNILVQGTVTLPKPGTAELAIHMWAGYQTQFTDQQDGINSVSNIARFVPSLAKAYAAVPTDGSYTGVFYYDVAQNAGAWLAQARTFTVEEFEAHVDTLVRKGIAG